MTYREIPNVLLYEPFQMWTEQECNDFIIRAESTLEKGRVYNESGYPEARTNYISWVTLNDQEFDYCWSIVKPFHSILNWFEHPVQISKYSVDQYYDWHRDSKPGTKRKSVRELTLTCTLKPAEGATLELRDRVYNLQVGQAVIFPSKVDHKANSPVNGERWAFTIWYMKHNTQL